MQKCRNHKEFEFNQADIKFLTTIPLTNQNKNDGSKGKHTNSDDEPKLFWIF